MSTFTNYPVIPDSSPVFPDASVDAITQTGFASGSQLPLTANVLAASTNPSLSVVQLPLDHRPCDTQTPCVEGAQLARVNHDAIDPHQTNVGVCTQLPIAASVPVNPNSAPSLSEPISTIDQVDLDTQQMDVGSGLTSDGSHRTADAQKCSAAIGSLPPRPCALVALTPCYARVTTPSVRQGSASSSRHRRREAQKKPAAAGFDFGGAA